MMRAGGQVDVPVLQRGLDFVDADLVGGQQMRVHLHVHGVFLRAQHLHLRDAADHRDALGDARLGVFIQRPQRQVWRREARYRMGWSAGFTLVKEGGVGMPGGSKRAACVMAACTSTAAPSSYCSRSNSSVTCVEPSELVEVIESRPAMVVN